MGEFPSGQRGQTVNLLRFASMVRIRPPPPSVANKIDATRKPLESLAVFAFSKLNFPFDFNLNSTNFDTYKIIPDHIKHHLQKSHGILKKMLAFLCEVYYNRDILNPRKQGFVWH